jgi:hypothetical protein
MHILLFDCAICKKLYGKPKQRFGLKKGAELKEHEWFAQCMGCGSFGRHMQQKMLNKLHQLIL